MKTSVVFLGLMMASSVIFAQKKFDPQAMGARQTEKMKTELTLTDEQYAAVKSINETYANKQLAVRDNSALSRDDKMQQIKTLGAEKHEALKKVLTQEQSTKWEAYRAEHRKKGRHRS